MEAAGRWAVPTVEAMAGMGMGLRLRPRLSRRERETLLYTAAGRSRPEIATLLGVGPTSVRTYQQRFTAKLAAENVQHAVSRALLLGLVRELALIDAAAVRKLPSPPPGATSSHVHNPEDTAALPVSRGHRRRSTTGS